MVCVWRGVIWYRMVCRERKALKNMFLITGGPRWSRRDNWGTKKPLREWYGLTVSNYGNVLEIRLEHNNLTGVGERGEKGENGSHFSSTCFFSTPFAGPFPDLRSLKHLQGIYFDHNNLRGEKTMPRVACATMHNLYIVPSSNTQGGFGGTDILRLKRLEAISLRQNLFSGLVPWEAFQHLKRLREVWLSDNRFDGESFANEHHQSSPSYQSS